MTAIDYILSGGVTATTARVMSRIAHTKAAITVTPDTKVVSFVWDPGAYSTGDAVHSRALYVDSELVDGTTAPDARGPDLGQLYIGSDYDKTCFFKGLACEIVMVQGAMNAAQRLDYERYLASKWLRPGQLYDAGWYVPNSILPEPAVTKLMWLDASNNSSITKSGASVTAWQDLAAARQAVPESGTTPPTVETVGGRQVLRFSGASNLVYPSFAIAPYSWTMFMVMRWDGLNEGGDQAFIKSDLTGVLRLKYYSGDPFVSFKYGDANVGNLYVDIPNATIYTYENTVPVSPVGTGRLFYGTSSNLASASSTPSQATDTDKDGTLDFHLTGLTPGRTYYCWVEADGQINSTKRLTFNTPPQSPCSFSFVFGSCNNTESDHPVWSKIAALKPMFLAHLGDLHYNDIGVNNRGLFDDRYLAQYTLPGFQTMLQSVPFAYVYDDHDFGVNNCDKNSASKPAAIQSYDLHVPSYALPFDNMGARCQAWTIGRVRFLMTENRSQRDPWQDPDTAAKTMLGADQKTWFKSQVLAAQADPNIALTVWLNPMNWAGGDFTNPYGFDYKAQGGREGWGAYLYEKIELATFFHTNLVKNLVVLCGDVHMQAMDDGRNTYYATSDGLPTGARIDVATIPEERRIPVIEWTPFDRDNDLDGGPYQIDQFEDSGLPNQYPASFAHISVTDTGHDWIQVRVDGWAYVDNTWTITKSFVFNRPAVGAHSDPPVIQTTFQNGYAGVGGAWKAVSNRYVGVGGTWKRQLHRFIGQTGWWRRVFSEDNLDPDGTFALTHLDAYTLERENFVFAHGNGFVDIAYPMPQIGAYYELRDRDNDFFDNFANGTRLGTPTFQQGGGLRLNTAGDAFQLPTTGAGLIDNQSLFGADGDMDAALSLWVYIPDLPGANAALWSTNGIGLYVTPAGKLNLQVGATTFTTTEGVTAGAVNKIVFNRCGVDPVISELWLNGAKTALNLATLVIPAQTISAPVLIGAWMNGATVTSSTGFIFQNVYYRRRYMTPTAINRLSVKPTPVIIFRDTSSGSEYQVPAAWVGSMTNTKVGFTVPTDIPNGSYEFFLRSLTRETLRLPVKVVDVAKRTTALVDDFTDPFYTRQHFYALNKGWGGANGGVSDQNCFIEDGRLIIEAHGDLYTGLVQGADRDGNPKFHTAAGDPLLGQPWRTRVGGCMILKEKTGFGSYIVRAKIAPLLGVCTAMWTFFYNEIYPQDPRYQSFKDEGLHEQGTALDGYYITRNHEIDIELPSHLVGGQSNQPSLNHMKNNNWRGELWDESSINLVDIGFSVGDGEEHELRFDWHNDRVEFYIDGVLKSTVTQFVPDIPGHFTFGMWFPSWPLAAKPWLADPAAAWAGGTVDTDGGMKAPWAVQRMEVSHFSFTPFAESGERLIAETYPFGGYRSAGFQN